MNMLRLNDYLRQCEAFWKEKHERTYEKKLAQLNEAKKRVANVYALTGYDACYALMLALRHLRAVLPLPKYPEHATALEALEAIKTECYEELGTHFKGS